MKKVITMFIIIVTIALISAVALGDAKNEVYFQSLIDDYTKAEEKGERIEGFGYLYEGILYYDTTIWTSMDLEKFGVETRWELAEAIVKALREECGIKHAQCYIKKVGNDIYDMELYTMYNLNNVKSDGVVGNGYVRDGFEYYGIRCLTHIVP